MWSNHDDDSGVFLRKSVARVQGAKAGAHAQHAGEPGEVRDGTGRAVARMRELVHRLAGACDQARDV